MRATRASARANAAAGSRLGLASRCLPDAIVSFARIAIIVLHILHPFVLLSPDFAGHIRHARACNDLQGHAQTWGPLGPFWALWYLWGRLGPSGGPLGALWGPLDPFGSLWGLLEPFGTLLCPFGSFGALWGPLLPVGAIWGLDTIWLPLGPFCVVWNPLGPFGTIWGFWVLSVAFWGFLGAL